MSIGRLHILFRVKQICNASAGGLLSLLLHINNRALCMPRLLHIDATDCIFIRWIQCETLSRAVNNPAKFLAVKYTFFDSLRATPQHRDFIV